MAIHDWSIVGNDIFHHFQHQWVTAISNVLNEGALPNTYYALAEPVERELAVKPVVRRDDDSVQGELDSGTLSLNLQPPKVWQHARSEVDLYTTKAKNVAIRHTSNDELVAIIEIVSPGNKSSRASPANFVEKAAQVLRSGINLMVLDLFPPGTFDPSGLHHAVWSLVGDDRFQPPADRPLTLASYAGGRFPEAFVEPVAVGATLPKMPLVLKNGRYIQLPLETAHQAAFHYVPRKYREMLAGTR